MKKVLYTSFSALGLLLTTLTTSAQSVGIGTITPSSSARLDITATNKGLLIPRVTLTTLTDAATIASPATSLLVYNTNATLGAGYYFNSGTPASPVWTKLLTAAGSSSGWSLTGNAGTTPATNFIGTTDARALRFRSNNAVVGNLSRLNVFLGDSAGVATNENVGNDNVGIGSGSLFSNDTGYYNVGVGSATLASTVSDWGSVAVGYGALSSSDDPSGYGNLNTAVGTLSLASTDNTGFGWYNSALGAFSLYYNIDGDHNTAVGAEADCFDTLNAVSIINATAIGAGALAMSDNEVRIGNDDVTQIGGITDWTTLSDGRYKKDIKSDNAGLSFIMQLRPVNYHYDFNKLNTERMRMISIAALRKSKLAGISDAKTNALLARLNSPKQKAKIALNETRTYNGLIAQEVEAAANKIGYSFSGVVKPTKPNGRYALRYATFVVPLIEAVQEQQKIIDNQNARIDNLEKRLLKLEKR